MKAVYAYTCIKIVGIPVVGCYGIGSAVVACRKVELYARTGSIGAIRHGYVHGIYNKRTLHHMLQPDTQQKQKRKFPYHKINIYPDSPE
jgi:hypothetical protein